MRFPRHRGEIVQEREVDHVSGIDPDAINAECLEPHSDRREVILADIGVREIKGDKLVVAGPGIVGEGITARAAHPEIHVCEPVPVRG